MLKKSFILGVLVSLSGFVFGDAPEDEWGILEDLGITREEAVSVGLWIRIEQVVKTRESFIKQYRVYHESYYPHTSFVDHMNSGWDYTKAEKKWEKEYYEKLLPALRKEYGDLKIEQSRHQRQQALQSQQLAVEKKRSDQLQATLVDIQKQLKEQSEKMDKLVAGNAQFIRFLVLMDSAITSERDIRARVEAAKQLLESDLVDEQQKVLLLNNKIKELKEKAETVAVENAELRAQMQAELEAIQVQLKERMLSMM